MKINPLLVQTPMEVDLAVFVHKLFAGVLNRAGKVFEPLSHSVSYGAFLQLVTEKTPFRDFCWSFELRKIFVRPTRVFGVFAERLTDAPVQVSSSIF